MLKRFIRHKLSAYLQRTLAPAIAESAAQRLSYTFHRERLSEQALSCVLSGTSPQASGRKPIVVSLTTHGRRLYEVHLSIESIMQGSILPQEIVLWLDDDDSRELPIALQRQAQRGLKVMRTNKIGSYAKLLPTLKSFPLAHIVTIDDDVFYPRDFLERLIETHESQPKSIIANVIMQMTRDNKGNPQGIRKWPYVSSTESSKDWHDLFFEGFGGVFYPAGCLPQETTDEALFKQLSPTADDIWFNAMARIIDTPIQICNRSPFNFLTAVNIACQDEALYRINNDNDDKNEKQLRAVWQHFRLQGK